ncbi:MAG TPA: ABC transporter ATP-binding protein [Tetragenococcus sp.]|nr:ABC transporter ATP-binding protein [Tetragenococcus sp.]
MKLSQVKKNIDHQIILENISFTIQKNQIVGLIGRNGSGKTTLFRTIAGQYFTDGGEITIDEQNIELKQEMRQEIFFIDEKENFFNNYSLKKINAFFRTAYPKFDQDLFTELIKKHHLPINLAYKRLSKGMQGLFRMILAICSNASYLLLDEPFDGLDVIVKKEVIRLLLENLSQSNRCALIASHNLNELEDIVDRVLLLKGNTITFDYELESVREKSRKVQLVFRQKEIPVFIKQSAKLIEHKGRVITALFDEFTPELKEQIEAYDPLVFEELPLTLEDIFEANLSQEQLMKGFGV